MPITINTSELKVRDANGNYQDINVFAAGNSLTEVEAAIEEKGAETIASIPSDYTALANEVTDLKNTFGELSGREETFTTTGVGRKYVNFFIVKGNTYTIYNESNVAVGNVRLYIGESYDLIIDAIDGNSSYTFVAQKEYDKVSYYENTDCQIRIVSKGIDFRFDEVSEGATIKVQNLADSLSAQKEYVEGSNLLYGLKNITFGKYLDGNVEHSNPSYCYTDFIELYNLDDMHFATSDVICDFYDSNKTYKSQIAPSANQRIRIPDNSKYVKISLPIAKLYTTYFGSEMFTTVEHLAENLLSQAKYVQGSNLLLGLKNVTFGKYISNNVEYSNASYCHSDFIELYNDTELCFATNDAIIDFYDESKAYKSQLAPSANQRVRIPEGSKYVKISLPIAKLYTTYFGTEKDEKSDVIIVSGGESILEGVILCYEKGYKKVIVEGGTYDIIQEYKDHFGDDCFDNYDPNDDYNYNNMGLYGRGIWLNNIEIIFRPNAHVVAHYVATDQSTDGVHYLFSPFATGDNVIIDGLNLDASNLRYGIHADYNYSDGWSTLVLRNCDLKLVRMLNGEVFQQAVGAGFGKHSDWLIEDCIFRSINDTAVFRVHNNVYGQAQSKMKVKNCYVDGAGFMRFNAYSTSELITEILVSGCSWINEAVVGKETDESYMNFHMISWNNETRQE